MCTYLHIYLKQLEVNTPKCWLWLLLGDVIMDDFSSFITFVIIIIKKRNIRYFLSTLALFTLKCIGERKKHLKTVMQKETQTTDMEIVRGQKYK